VNYQRYYRKLIAFQFIYYLGFAELRIFITTNCGKEMPPISRKETEQKLRSTFAKCGLSALSQKNIAFQAKLLCLATILDFAEVRILVVFIFSLCSVHQHAEAARFRQLVTLGASNCYK
jgi:hypothetical protein